jgi:hypothetical protein
MRCCVAGKVILCASMIAVASAHITQASGEGHFCPNPAHASPQKVPPDLMPAVAKAFQIDDAVAREAAFVRCAGRRLMGCYTGANLNCFKADKRRLLPGATAWCQDNPGSKNIPMAATGHDTIYEWSCDERRAVAGKAMLTVDPQGYIAENWKDIP